MATNGAMKLPLGYSGNETICPPWINWSRFSMKAEAVSSLVMAPAPADEVKPGAKPNRKVKGA